MAEAMPGLMKLAQLIPMPSIVPTVGDAMRSVSSDMSLSPAWQHEVKQRIVDTGLPVSSPASRLASIGLGAAVGTTIGSAFSNNSLLGRMIGNYTGLGGLAKPIGAIVGGLYGNMMYNKANPDPHHAHGFNVYTY